MTRFREILRLLSLGISERKIAESCRVSWTQYPSSVKELTRQVSRGHSMPPKWTRYWKLGCIQKKRMIQKLPTCEYLVDSLNIFITGVTGRGKTYLPCALAMEALKQYITVKYVRLSNFFWSAPLSGMKNVTIKCCRLTLSPNSWSSTNSLPWN